MCESALVVSAMKQKSGHRRTYVGALPEELSRDKAGRNENPVFILDEIDKLAVRTPGIGERPARSSRPGAEQYLLGSLSGSPYDCRMYCSSQLPIPLQQSARFLTV